MKKLISFALAASFSLSLFATDIFDFAPIQGNVKTYTQTNFNIASKFGSYFRTPSMKIIHVLDENGKEIESTELSPKDVVLNKIITTYDSNGNVLEQSCINTEGELIWKNALKYKNGLKADATEYDDKNEMHDKVIYTYDGTKLVDETGYDKDGTLVWKTIFKYYETGKVEKESSFAADGVLDTRKTYTYLDDGKIETISTFDNYAKTTQKQVFRYDSKGVLTEITNYGNDNVINKRTTIKYDAKGNVSKVSEYNIAEKFETTVNELTSMVEYVFEY